MDRIVIAYFFSKSYLAFRSSTVYTSTLPAHKINNQKHSIKQRIDCYGMELSCASMLHL